MPSDKKSSANVGRKTSHGTSSSTHDRHQRSQGHSSAGSSPRSPVNVSFADDGRLSDDLMTANTSLNQVREERDKLQLQLALANRKLNEQSRLAQEAKDAYEDEIALLKEDLQDEKERYAQAARDMHAWAKDYDDLKARYEEAVGRAATLTLPERPKSSRGAGSSSTVKKEHRDDRGRTRDRDRKAEKEKERLSRRFEDRTRAPPPSSYRHSYEPPRRSASVSAATRSFPTVSTSRMQAPATTVSHQTAYSAIPRSAETASMMGSSAYGSGYSSGGYADGNYHLGS